MDIVTLKIKRNGSNKISIELPDDFIAEIIEVTIKSDSVEIKSKEEKANEKLRSELREFYSKFNVDLSIFKFNRDELYNRW